MIFVKKEDFRDIRDEEKNVFIEVLDETDNMIKEILIGLARHAGEDIYLTIFNNSKYIPVEQNNCSNNIYVAIQSGFDFNLEEKEKSFIIKPKPMEE